jgi:hypothetical protein
VSDIFGAHVLSLILAGLAVISVVSYIPVVSDVAFWIMLAAYALLASSMPPEKK